MGCSRFLLILFCLFLTVTCWSELPVPPLEEHWIISSVFDSMTFFSVCVFVCVCVCVCVCVLSATCCPFVYLSVQFFHHKPCVYLGCWCALTAKPCGKVCACVFMLDGVLDSEQSEPHSALWLDASSSWRVIELLGNLSQLSRTQTVFTYFRKAYFVNLLKDSVTVRVGVSQF